MRLSFRNIVALIFALTALVGCENIPNPVDTLDDAEKMNNSQSDHVYARGFVILKNGMEQVRGQSGTVSGSFAVKIGKDKNIFNIEFLDENGNLITPHRDDFSLAWTRGNTRYASIQRYGDFDRWEFNIRGEQVGPVRFQLMLMHGEHVDYKTPVISLEVQQ